MIDEQKFGQGNDETPRPKPSKKFQRYKRVERKRALAANPNRRPHRKKSAAQKAATKEKARAHMANMRLVTAHLTMQHFVNGKAYGPGECKIPNHLATEFANREYHARKVEEQFQGTKGVIVGPRSSTGAHVTIPVPVETFDESYANAAPFSRVSGANMEDTGKGDKI